MAAVPFFSRAIEIDPTPPTLRSGVHVATSGNPSSLPRIPRKLIDYATAPVSRRSSWLPDLQVTGNLEKAQSIREVDASLSTCVVGSRAVVRGIYPQLGKYEKSVDKIALGVDPDFSIGYSILTASYLALERTAEAENTLQQASERKLEILSSDSS